MSSIKINTTSNIQEIEWKYEYKGYKVGDMVRYNNDNKLYTIFSMNNYFVCLRPVGDKPELKLIEAYYDQFERPKAVEVLFGEKT